MTTILAQLLRLPLTYPFVLAFLKGDGITPLVVACDLLEEQDDESFHALARALRAALLGG